MVLTASINARKGMPGTSVCGATKAAVVNLAKTLSADLVQRGVRVNAISPGPVHSALLARIGMSEEQLHQTRDWIRSQVLLKRFADPAEIAEAVLYLCSSERLRRRSGDCRRWRHGSVGSTERDAGASSSGTHENAATAPISSPFPSVRGSPVLCRITMRAA